jgi:DNA repair protein RadC
MARTSPDSEIVARLVAAGPRALDDVEALQLAAGLSAAQAAALFAEFGSLPQALACSDGALRRCVSAAKAARVLLLRDVARRIHEAPLLARSVLGSREAVSDYLNAVLAGAVREELHALYLDGRNRLIRDEVMGAGTVDHVPVYPREIVRRALELGASAVVLAHNRPDGHASPSVAVVEATRQVVGAGRAVGVLIHDHLLLADREVVSFRSLGLL